MNFGTAIVRIVERHRSRHVHSQVAQRLRILAVCSAEKSTVTYVTWNTSSFDKSRIIEFYDSLKKLVPVGTSIYDCHELHQSGESHYHFVLRFPAKVHWPNGRRKFYIEGNTESIRIENPRPSQPIRKYLENVQAYIENPLELACPELGLEVGDDKPDGWIFGERVDAVSSAALERKRVFDEVHPEDDYDIAERLLRDADNVRFIYSIWDVKAYLDSKKTKVVQPAAKRRCVCEDDPWRLPEEIVRWKRDNIDTRSDGRKKSLVLVGVRRVNQYGLSRLGIQSL